MGDGCAAGGERACSAFRCGRPEGMPRQSASVNILETQKAPKLVIGVAERHKDRRRGIGEHTGVKWPRWMCAMQKAVGRMWGR